MPNTAIDALKKAARGLVYTSETDEPVNPFAWKDDGGPITGEKVVQLSHSDPKAKVAEVPLDDFFATQAADDEGQDEEAKASAGKFQALRQMMGDHLSDVKAFRVGEVNVRYFVVGRTKGGDLAGISAKAVET